MLFNSYQFIIFFVVVITLYYIIPNKVRNVFLLIASMYFYSCYNLKYVLLLLCATLTSYLSGRLIERESVKTKNLSKVILYSQISLNIMLLVIFKYLDFLFDNINKLLSMLHITASFPDFGILLPIGISFYLFQTMGYVIDVYRENAKAENNIIDFALFVSFFPQLVAGPIERFNNLMPQFKEKHSFDFEKIKHSLLLMLWGFFMKIVIADRIAIYVDAVYGDYYKYGGWYIILASVLFAFQIYCDFAGYSTIAVGVAGALGFKLMNNFDSPYCALNIKDFWGRWHISLTGWFKDYLYIPLGGNKKGTFRKYINIMIVFLTSGLWHGAMWNYVIWGFLNGLFQVLSDLFKSLKRKIPFFNSNRSVPVTTRILQAIITFFMVDFTWIFFRASGTKEAFMVLKAIFPLNNLNIFFDRSIFGPLDEKNFKLMLISVIVLLFVDILHKSNIHIRQWVYKQSIWFRFLFYILLIESILVFGIWGVGYDATSFIYFKF